MHISNKNKLSHKSAFKDETVNYYFKINRNFLKKKIKNLDKNYNP